MSDRRPRRKSWAPRLSWKALYYGPFMAALRALPFHVRDAIHARLARMVMLVRRTAVWRALARASQSACYPAMQELADQSGRMLARDCMARPFELQACVRVEGFEHVARLQAQQQGAIVLGCHLGGYIPALRWMYEAGVPLRLLVQRPTHVSRFLKARFDDETPPFPQQAFFVGRGQTAQQRAERILRSHSALRRGLMIYSCGDIPWHKGRVARFLGVERRFQSIWLDLAIATGAPVIAVFAFFETGGALRIVFDPPMAVCSHDGGGVHEAYLRRLEYVVRDRPDQAWPYWSWPAYSTEGGHLMATEIDSLDHEVDLVAQKTREKSTRSDLICR